MCDCINTLEKKILASSKAARCGMEHFGSQSTEFYITPIRKDGQPAKHDRYTSIEWCYCPFCGVKINGSSLTI
jgi:hypothetical protein